MNPFGDTGFWSAWLQLLSTPIGGILLALALIRLAFDLMPSAATRKRQGRRKAGARPVSWELAPLAGLITLLWLFVPGYKIYTGMASSAVSHRIAWSTFDDVLTTLVLMAGVAVSYAVGHDRHHIREAIRLDLELDQIKALTPSGFEAFVAELFRSQGYRAEIVGGEGDHGRAHEARLERSRSHERGEGSADAVSPGLGDSHCPVLAGDAR